MCMDEASTKSALRILWISPILWMYIAHNAHSIMDARMGWLQFVGSFKL